jgi:hypothetical protein
MTSLDAEKLASFVLRQVNRVGRVRDGVYLDTNAWSTLAKGTIPTEPLQAWLHQNACHLWMARFQLAELTGDTRLARPVADLLRHLPVWVLDYGQNEFQGDPWYKVKVDHEEFIRLDQDDLFDEFVAQLDSGPIQEARNRLAQDGENFRIWVEQAQANNPLRIPRNWHNLPERLERWIRFQCERNNVPINERALLDRDCYVGLRLSFSVLYLRYFITSQTWCTSDYIDYLHASDMPYARVVVTERNLAECIRQAAKRPEVSAPETVVDLSWLTNPSGRRRGSANHRGRLPCRVSLAIHPLQCRAPAFQQKCSRAWSLKAKASALKRRSPRCTKPIARRFNN